MNRYRDTRLRCTMFVVLSFALCSFAVFGQTAPDPAAVAARAAGINQLTATLAAGAAPSEPARIFKTPDGYLRFVGAPPAAQFPTASAPGASPEAVAQAFLGQWRDLFVSKSPAVGFQRLRIRTAGQRSYVHFQETYGPLPVFGAEIAVQVNGGGGVTSVLGSLMRETDALDSGKVATKAAIAVPDAQNRGIEFLAKENKPLAFQASLPTLMVYDPSVIENPGGVRLVWHLEVSNVGAPVVKEVVLVDAATGEIALHYPLIHDAKNRQIYDANNVPGVDPGTLVRSEGQIPCGITDADLAYTYFGDTYDFYYVHHGRDSINNAGYTLSGTVRYCPAGQTPPYRNAFWNGSRMYFGQGFSAADDVVAHELTHGVTQYESNLIYANQSGAINESFSDMWGEWVDLNNGSGTDTPAVRWLMGEDIPGIGAIRDMANPPAFGDPDRRYSPLWYSGTGDNGGVHTNSGVGNKLCYLLTDGDTFNGHIVAALGTTKTASLFYECQVNLLTQSSNYNDLYVAATQAAINIGLNSTERDSVEQGCQAVEIKPAPAGVTNFNAVSSAGNPNVTLTWVNPTQAGLVSIIIRRDTTTYPAAPTSGTAVYNGLSTTTVDGPLSVGTRYYYSAWAYYGGVDYSLPAQRQVVAGADTPDYFTELFDGNDNDLDNNMFTLTPNGSSSFYAAFSEPATAFPTNPALGTNLTLSDDSSVQVNLTGGAQVYLYGTAYTSFYVGSNGYITFTAGDTAYSESYANHFDLPRISGLFDDLNPSAGGTISWKQLSDRVAVTFQGVPEYSTTNSNNFQIEMLFDGTIRITWLGIAATDGLAGVSRGTGVPSDFNESDLTAYNPTTRDALRVLPATCLTAGGPQGGPFSPASKPYALTNTSGTGTLNWSAATTQPWMTVTPGSGTLSAGNSTTVTVSINANANSLPPGEHTGTITFTNVTSGFSQTREARLTVATPPPAPTNPQPADGATGVPVDTQLSWNGGGVLGVSKAIKKAAEGASEVPMPEGRDDAAFRVHNPSQSKSAEASAGSRPGPRSTQAISASGSLTTLFAANNGYAGNMFDVVVATPLTIAGFDVNVSNPGTVNTVSIYYRLGTCVGHENSPDGWVLLGTDTNVVSNGTNVPTPVNIGGLHMEPGQIYGLYVNVASYPSCTMEYTDGGPTVFSNADMALTTYVGKGSPAFTGGTFSPRKWNGTVYYNTGSAAVYDVYFDTVNPPTTLIRSGLIQTQCAPVPSPLAYGTTYSWQVVARNVAGATTGPVWSFTTASPVYPPVPFNPDPRDGATSVPIDKHLSWNNTTEPLTAAVRAFDAADGEPLRRFSSPVTVPAGAEANLKEATLLPVSGISARRPELLPSATVARSFPSSDSTVVASVGFIDSTQIGYFWSATRGDSVRETFLTSLPTIQQAVFDFVVPTNGLASGALLDWNVTINGVLIGTFRVSSGQTGPVHKDFTFAPISGPSYTVLFQATNTVPSGLGAHTLGYAGIHAGTVQLIGATSAGTTNDLFFGTVNPPATRVATGLISPTYDPGTLAHNTTYYWKVIARNLDGPTTGPVWSFTTASPVYPPVPFNPDPPDGATSVPIRKNLSWNNPSSWTATLGFAARPMELSGEGGSYRDGVKVDAQGESPARPAASRHLSVVPPGGTLINFDDFTAPPVFASTTRLTNRYAALGVTFEGPGGNDGGAVLNEAGGFGVSGHSSPNFLAFNAGSSLSDGGIPRGPETIRFAPAVSSVSILAGSGSGAGAICTMRAYNAFGAQIAASSLTMASTLRPLAVSAPDISRVVVSTPASVMVLDDLIFVQNASAPVVYDVYFGTVNPPTTRIATGISSQTCNPGVLSWETRYFWRVIARNLDGPTTGPVWTFRTVEPPGHIRVSDSIPPSNDLAMPFGDVDVGRSSTETITVSNVDTSHPLVVRNVRLTGGYLEDFNDGLAQDWVEITDPQWSVVSGEYRAMAGVTGLRMQSTYIGQTWQDCTVQVTMRRTGYLGSAVVLFWRATNDFSWVTNTGSAYATAISGDGQFWVIKYVNGSLVWLQSWTASPYLNTGATSNVVSASIQGTSISVYHNGHRVWSGSDSTIPGPGRIGLAAYSGSGPETIHYFDDVTVGEAPTFHATLSPAQQWYNEHASGTGTPDEEPKDWTPPVYPGAVEPADSIEPIGGPILPFHLARVPSLPVVVPPGGSFTFDVGYRPTSFTTSMASVFIDSDDLDSPTVRVALSGRGISIPPTVVSISRTDASPSSAPVVRFSVEFSEAVVGVEPTDFRLSTIGITGTSVSGVLSGPLIYTVTVNTGSGDGAIRLDVIDDDTIHDLAGAPLGGPGAGNGSFLTGPSYVFDKTPPGAPGRPDDGGVYTTSPLVTFTWTTAVDGGTSPSGIASYDLQVGTSVGLGDIFDGNIGNVVTRQVTGSDGQRLFARVRARDRLGNIGPWSQSSDGILIDASAPQSRVLPLPLWTASTTFTIRCEATDAVSGVKDVRLWYRRGLTGAYRLWANPFTSGTLVFDVVAAGRETGLYQFYSIARDQANNTELAPSTPDAQITVDSQARAGRWESYR